MDYKKFVEELVKEIGKETGLRVEFCAADEEETQDCMNVYTNENGKLRLLTEKIYCKMKTEGKTLSEVVQAVKQSTDDFLKMGISGKLKQLQCYEQVKDKLFIRLLNVEKNKEELGNSLYKQNGEIALTLYMKISNEDGKLTSCKVPLSYVEKWPVKKETVFEEAMKNTMSMMPPRVCEVLKLVDKKVLSKNTILKLRQNHMVGFLHMLAKFCRAVGNCMSTRLKTNGAVAIFYPGVAKTFCHKLGADGLYLVFTSVHEVMIHDEESVEPENLKTILEETIEEAIPEEDVLTRHIYHYDLKSDQIEMMAA